MVETRDCIKMVNSMLCFHKFGLKKLTLLALIFASCLANSSELIRSELCSSKIGAGGNLVTKTGVLAGKCEGAGLSPILSDLEEVEFNVGTGDKVSAGKDRTELAFTDIKWPLGKAAYVEFDIYMPVGVDETETWYYLFQLWQGPSHPPIAGLRVNRGTANQVMLFARSKSSKSGEKVGLYNLKLGQWNKIRMKVLVNPDQTGSIITYNASGNILNKWYGSVGFSEKDKGYRWFRVKFGIYKGHEHGKRFAVKFRGLRLMTKPNW